MLELFDALMVYLSQHRIKTVIYKAIPHIYHIVPAEEDLYALFRHNAKVVQRDASSTIVLDQQIPFSRQKRRCIKLGKRNELVVKRTDDFRAYMSIVAEVTARKFECRSNSYCKGDGTTLEEISREYKALCCLQR